ncbi:hypothetical protein DL89DRAFT_39265 [Linderina pennispora]|uniref:Uncharacterized protein n=1 Tax=Linderina pennispora TaxID=61395 RepID=A0A1Y1W3K6_9FUNG|nr:uncharacterized protein DL89DRAFT_39265 [Linderina pennispora]ORX67962.1 hypothetical protein DL89DRAFT_39265 [Linderina pennispora]
MTKLPHLRSFHMGKFYSLFQGMALQYSDQSKTGTDNKRDILLSVVRAGYILLLNSKQRLESCKGEYEAALNALAVTAKESDRNQAENCQKNVGDTLDRVAAAVDDVKAVASQYQRDLDILRKFDKETPSLDGTYAASTPPPQACRPQTSSEWTEPRALPNEIDEYFTRAMSFIDDFMRFERWYGNGPFSPGYRGSLLGKVQKKYFMDNLAEKFKTVMKLALGVLRVEINEIGPRFDLGIHVDIFDKDPDMPRMTLPIFFGEEAAKGI